MAQKKRRQTRKPAVKKPVSNEAVKPESPQEQPEAMQAKEVPMTEELNSELIALRKRNAELEEAQKNHKAEMETTIANTLEAMKQSTNIEIAKVRVRIDSFPGVDRTKPRWYGIAWDKIEGGDVVPLNGVTKIKIRGGGSTIVGEQEIRVIDGLFVTNDIKLAQMLSKDTRFTGVQPVK